jgi:RNA polymerase sigma-70 factor (ECF subfamily)
MVDVMRQEIEEAIQLLKSEQPDSMEQALALLQNSVFSFSMRVCQQREDAEDTMQEVLVKSLPYLRKFDSPKALVVWLYKVAKNRCLMSRRKGKFAPQQSLSLEELMPDRHDLEQFASTGPINPESLTLRSEEAQRLRDAVQKLPPDYRIILVLRDMEGLTDEEVAEITGLRRGTVRVRLHRARLFVRKKFSGSLQPRAPRRAASQSATPLVRSRHCKEMFAELSDYLDDQLDDSLCEELESHLGGCEPCQAFVSGLETTIQQIRKTPNEPLDQKKAATIRKQLLSLQSELIARR